MSDNLTQKGVKIVKTEFNKGDYELKNTMKALTFMRQVEHPNENDLVVHLDESWNECKSQGIEYVFLRVVFNILDVNRTHNIFRRLKIKGVEAGGQGSRVLGRMIIRFLEDKVKDWFYSNLQLIPEYSVWENLWYNEQRTTRGTPYKPAVELGWEHNDFDWNIIMNFVSDKINSGHDIDLIAKHLPKWVNGEKRVRKVTIQRDGTFKIPSDANWVKHNGSLVTKSFAVKAGDEVRISKNISEITFVKRRLDHIIIGTLLDIMGWSLADYNNFRKQQGTPEQLFSSKKISNMDKISLYELFNTLTAGQRYRVMRMCLSKSKFGEIKVRDKWKHVAETYLQWEKDQADVSKQIHEANKKDDEEKKQELIKKAKIKTTGFKSDTITPEDEIVSLVNDPRYSIINY